MKVVWIFRKPTVNAFSIERVFLNIKKEMCKKVDIEVFKASERKSLLKNIFILRKLKSDILHITGDINYYAFFLPKDKLIITVHDIGHYIHTLKGIKRKIYGYIWLYLPIKRAKKVTCVSNKTFEDINTYFPKLAQIKKITVIENAYPRDFNYIEKTFSKNKPRILQVGTSSYKNIEKVIQALHEIPCIFVLIGKLTNEQKKLLLEKNIEYENYFNLDESELLEEYKKSDIVTFISIGEGFGLPIIEAQAIGRALITSNISPLKDIAGDGAYLVNPKDIKDIRSGIQRLIDDDQLRNKIVQLGLKNVQKYSPENIADKYLVIYNEIKND
jgi:glycosyltransferase involved in cell wall biosynthesis